jgi:hypothetical protein
MGCSVPGRVVINTRVSLIVFAKLGVLGFSFLILVIRSEARCVVAYDYDIVTLVVAIL